MSFVEHQFQDPETSLSVMGSFWSRFYENKDHVEAIFQAAGLVLDQIYEQAKLAYNVLSYETLPVFQTVRWWPLRIRQSELLREAKVAYFDGSYAFDSSLQYDVPARADWYGVALPAELTELEVLCDQFENPTKLLINGDDFVVSRGYIYFREDPFSWGLPEQVTTSADGVTDREIVLFAQNAKLDRSLVQRFWGYVLGGFWKSSEASKSLLGSLLAALPAGATVGRLLEALEAICGIRFAEGDGETVQWLTFDRDYELAVTDKQVYKAPHDTDVFVAEGDTLKKGQPVVQTVQWHIATDGKVPDWVDAIALGKELLPWCRGEIVFANKDVPLVVDENHSSGYTYVEFEIGGNEQDVAEFFKRTHERGIELAAEADPCQETTLKVPGYPCDNVADYFYRPGTLAHLLDRRANRVGEPKAEHLPATINPLQWLVGTLFRGKAMFVKIKSSGLTQEALGLWSLFLLRRLVPPWAVLFVIIELDTTSEELEPGDETLGTLDAAEPLVESATPGTDTSDELFIKLTV